MTKRGILIMILCGMFPLCRAQEMVGIQFEQQTKWSEIQSKAKAEHKYIFVDCYATWCGPCKAMDEKVYPKKIIGNLYNKEFISVKLQMDRTPQDESYVKSWYETAHSLENAYKI